MDPRTYRSESPAKPHTWLLAIASGVLGLALLALAAAPLGAPAAPPSSFAVEAEPSEVEFELEPGDWEFEEEWEEEEEEAESSADQCPLHSTTAHGTTKRNKLKLTVGYTTSEPANARIEVRSGSTSLGTYKRHLGRSGVLRFTKTLGKKHAGKVVVDVSVPTAGRYCADEAAVLFK